MKNGRRHEECEVLLGKFILIEACCLKQEMKLGIGGSQSADSSVCCTRQLRIFPVMDNRESMTVLKLGKDIHMHLFIICVLYKQIY